MSESFNIGSAGGVYGLYAGEVLRFLVFAADFLFLEDLAVDLFLVEDVLDAVFFDLLADVVFPVEVVFFLDDVVFLFVDVVFDFPLFLTAVVFALVAVFFLAPYKSVLPMATNDSNRIHMTDMYFLMFMLIWDDNIRFTLF
ncbi:MAG: hypothetical protein HDS48_00005 [Bacteroides sp.]|nr:hypothetical protein [Bacteroides sp.]